MGADLLWKLFVNIRHQAYREQRNMLLDALDDAIAWGLRDAECELNEQISDLDDQYYQENDNVQD
jgi:hypothetical protein